MSISHLPNSQCFEAVEEFECSSESPKNRFSFNQSSVKTMASLLAPLSLLPPLASLLAPLSLPPLSTIALIYAAAELLFFLTFYLYLLPRANRRKSPEYIEPYHDYGKTRTKLLLRIIDRIEEHCKREGTEVIPRVEEFLGNWFCVCGDVVKNNNDTSCTDDTDPTDSADEDENDGLLLPNGHAAKSRSSSFLRRGDMDIFFAWAFFGKPLQSLLAWERRELVRMYQVIEERIGLRFDRPGTTQGIKPMRLTLDDVRATYRPLAVYGMFCGLGILAKVVLRCCGFEHCKSKSGQAYWHRQFSEGQNKDIPLLFNHGIAPGGLALYLPMILFGFGPLGKGNADRTLLLFETSNISFKPSFAFDAVSEDAYVAGVCEAIDTHLDRNELERSGLAIMGHSFGSCNVTWSIRSNDIRKHMRRVYLIDPVSVMLSEPDVMTNFLYAGRDTSNLTFVEAMSPIFLFPFYYVMGLLRPANRSRVAESKRGSNLFRTYSSYSAGKEPKSSGGYNKIIMVQSELWIEHYLRRNFSWYNSELWLDDLDHLHPDTKIVVAIAEKDEILSASKVLAEATRYKEKNNNVAIINWANAGHAYAVPRPWTWKQLQSACH